MAYTLSNSRTASLSVCLEAMSESVRIYSGKGIYIGRTSIYKMPFLFDADAMLNPHVSVIGTSGSGKTFMLKALIVRSALHLGCNVLVLDWTGEYSKIVEYLSGRELVIGNDFDTRSLDHEKVLAGVTSLNMSRLRQGSERERVTRSVVGWLVGVMHSHGIGNRSRQMIVLDEAWRLVSGTNELGALFREGRKYGFGVVLATQLVSDIRNEAISNSATMAIFRLQNSDDIGILATSGIIDAEDMRMVSGLSQGSCLLHLAFKDSASKRKNLVIERISGVETDVYELRCSNMRVSEKKFRDETDRLQLSEDARARLYGFIDASDRRIDETALADVLLKLGLDRPKIVTYMRFLGLDDASIVAAYEAAVANKKH